MHASYEVDYQLKMMGFRMQQLLTLQTLTCDSNYRLL